MDTIQKFQDLLKRLFQFETSDLDFGIYRILNYKRDLIEKFIQEDLKNNVESAFAKHKGERLTNINQRFKEAKQKVIQGLGAQAFTPTGELKEEFKDTPLGREFHLIKTQKDEAETIDEIKLQVFNDLYNFFSRYYEEGDFVPQYRHSIKGHKYAIPYNGEEVKLYWANNEQYYIKTGLLFQDYTFKANDYKVIFRIVSAREELGSKKATKARFFIIDDENPSEELKDKALIIRFQYRELTEGEVRSYGIEGGSNTAKQEKINQRTYDEVLKKIKDIELKAPLTKDYKSEKPLLLYQISRFTAKNTKDYFIHKNLKKFLSEQLDYFIKAEVLDIETLEKERFLDKHITRAKAVREVGEDITDFLSQIEDFQKRLWEKKKFVLNTEYVITTDRVPVEFYKEIWGNKEQKKEWKDLGFEMPKMKEDFKERTLPIDTKYFGQEFKEKLLEKLTENADLDDLLDGLLIKSENWQALNLLLGRFNNIINCIYIDAPYNTGSDEFIYKDRYMHSSWLAMMSDRIEKGKKFLRPQGVFFTSIDFNEIAPLKILLEDIFSRQTFEGLITWRRRHNQPNDKTKMIGLVSEYLLAFAHDSGALRSAGVGKLDITGRFSNPDNDPRGDWASKPWKVGSGQSGSRYKITTPTAIVYEEEWMGDDQTYKQLLEDKRIIFPNNGNGLPRKKYFKFERAEEGQCATNWWPHEYFGNNASANQQMDDLFGTKTLFDNPKPVELVRGVILVAGRNIDYVMDFFGGTGTTAHAVMKLNKEDGGKRKYILVEMANYFDTVMIPRLKKVCYSFNWKEGTPQDTDGISQFFKYQILEQYEDTLDNIELRENKQAQLKFGDDYLLKYFLDYETRENPSLLNIDQLENPFSYKLKVNLEEVGEPQEMIVDIPETFNYLLGLKVKKIKTREIATPSARNDKKRKYLFVLGEKEGKEIAIVWREYNDNWNKDDFKEDKEFIIKELEPWAPHIVYVNGQSVLTPKLGKHTAEIRYIEPKFKNLMG